MTEIDLASLDGRFEGHRLRNRAAEARLLAVISERGIAEPLEGVEDGGRHVLLNGFKRWRCARTLGLPSVPYQSLGADMALGIVALLRASNDRSLSLLEQAGFVDELQQQHALRVGEIAAVLSRSKAWVSLRLGLLAEVTPRVRERLFAGDFPVYAYLYSVRPFTRINKVAQEDVERLVEALSGKRLSVREVDYLARSYFRGTDAVREQIRTGHVTLLLDQWKHKEQPLEGGTQFEQAMLKDIKTAETCLQRISAGVHDPRLASGAFRAQARLMLDGLLSRAPVFLESMRNLHDRCGQA